MPTADVHGPQRKVLSSSVRPVPAIYGTSGIALKTNKTLPFKVTREWSAPAGYYSEQWFLVDPQTKEVLFEAPARLRLMWGLQAPTEVTDEIHEPIDLAVGSYLIVFALGGLKGGELQVEAYEAPAEVAA
jgi:hypothetical protein